MVDSENKTKTEDIGPKDEAPITKDYHTPIEYGEDDKYVEFIIDIDD